MVRFWIIRFVTLLPKSLYAWHTISPLDSAQTFLCSFFVGSVISTAHPIWERLSDVKKNHIKISTVISKQINVTILLSIFRVTLWQIVFLRMELNYETNYRLYTFSWSSTTIECGWQTSVSDSFYCYSAKTILVIKFSSNFSPKQAT